MSHDVFLSHSAADRAAATAVLEALERAGMRCWIAPRDVPAGSEYGQQIVDAVKSCRVFLVIFSENANASPHVRREVERAVSCDRAIVPFRIADVAPTGAMEYCLGGTHWFDAYPAPLEPHVARLVTTLRQMLGPAVRKGEDAAATEPAARPSVVVLPFTNMSGDPEQEYFSDGITEDVITDLSKVSGLFVVARNTAFTYKGKAVKVQEICRELGVKYVLEGSVRKAGAREQRSIAQAPTDNVEAYTYYLRGRQFLHRHSRSYYRLAKRMFAKAVELDPAYARAYAGIADCDSFLFLHYHEDVSIDGILATSAQALAIDENLAEAHASRGLALSLVQRYPEAMAEFERAIALDPNSFEAHYFYARACFAQDRQAEAAAQFERATAVKPDDYQSPAMLVMIYRVLGRPHDVVTAARKVVEIAEQELSRHPENARPAYLGAASLIELGEHDRAREWIARAMATDPDDLLTRYNVACVYSKLGELDAAFDLLERLLPHANHETKAWVRHDPDFEPLRALPRYERILALLS